MVVYYTHTDFPLLSALKGIKANAEFTQRRLPVGMERRRQSMSEIPADAGRRSLPNQKMRRDAEAVIVQIDIVDPESENPVARKELWRVDKVAEDVRRHFAIRKRKERDRPFAHQVGEMPMIPPGEIGKSRIW